jgi:hypothetical protein
MKIPDPFCADPRPSCWINPAAFSNSALGTIANMGSQNLPCGCALFRDSNGFRIGRPQRSNALSNSLRKFLFNVHTAGSRQSQSCQ